MPSVCHRNIPNVYRLHGKSEYSRASIGLAHRKKIVANHQGHIFAGSAPEQGATFSVILPGKHI